MSFMDALGYAGGNAIAGQQILQDMDAKATDTQLTQQRVINAKQANDAGVQAAANKAALANWLGSQQALESTPTDTAGDTAAAFAKASKFAATRGDFDGATQMAKLAEGQLQVAGTEQSQLEKTQADNQDKFSTAAQDVQSNPDDPANHKRLYAAAIGAGVLPSDIPMPGTPEYKTFVNTSVMASMKGAARLAYQENIRKTQQAEKDRADAEDQRHEDAENARKDRAAAQAGMLEMRRSSLAIQAQLAQSTIDARKEKSDAAASGGAIGARQARAAINYGYEAARGLNMMGQMPAGETSGIFAHMENPTTILKSLESYGTNSLTPGQVQVLQTSGKGLGLELAQLATSGSGRGANKDVINELGAMSTPAKGDNGYEVMFKLANAADFVRKRMQTVDRTNDPKLQAAYDSTLQSLDRFPDPMDVMKLAQSKGFKMKATVDKTQGTMDRLRGLLQQHNIDAALNPAAPPAKAAVMPDDIQNLIKNAPGSK